MADNDIDVVFAESLRRGEAWMPASEDDGKAGPQASHALRHLDGIADHGAGEQGDAEAEGAVDFARYCFGEGAIEGAVDETGNVAGIAEGSGEAEQAERRAQEFSGVGREEEDYFASAAWRRIGHLIRLRCSRPVSWRHAD